MSLLKDTIRKYIQRDDSYYKYNKKNNISAFYKKFLDPIIFEDFYLQIHYILKKTKLDTIYNEETGAPQSPRLTNVLDYVEGLWYNLMEEIRQDFYLWKIKHNEFAPDIPSKEFNKRVNQYFKALYRNRPDLGPRGLNYFVAKNVGSCMWLVSLIAEDIEKIDHMESDFLRQKNELSEKYRKLEKEVRIKYLPEDFDFVIDLKEKDGIPFCKGVKKLKEKKPKLNEESFLRRLSNYYNNKPPKDKY